MLVPRPSTAVVGGQPIRDEALLTWAREVDRHGHRPRAAHREELSTELTKQGERVVVSRSRTVKGSVLALAAAFVMSACATHPGSAAVVGPE